MRCMGMLLPAFAAAMLAMAGVAAANPPGEPAPFGHACKAQVGVRFCPAETLAQRVPSFDSVPLDADVTLPPTGSGPFPTIVMLHGWGGSKTDFESSTPAGDGNETFDYNNAYYAQHGFAVVNYSARGWGNSCGAPQRLISRGVYRLGENQEGTVVFQLHGNGYEFAAGDTVKLQLLGRDAPYYRASNGVFSVEVSGLTVALPTL